MQQAEQRYPLRCRQETLTAASAENRGPTEREDAPIIAMLREQCQGKFVTNSMIRRAFGTSPAYPALHPVG
jgi:hypothetical protein